MPKTCKCGAEFEPINYPNSKIKTKLCVKCLIEKGKKKEKKEWNREKKQRNEKLKTLSDYKAEARAVFQKWVRIRDSNLPCISCGCLTSNLWDAGHFLDAGTYSGLIFHPDNVHKQCSYFCNRMRHGAKAEYRIGLIKRIGEDRVRWLEENKDRLRTYKYTKQELINIKKQYTEKIKSIKSHEKNS